MIVLLLARSYAGGNLHSGEQMTNVSYPECPAIARLERCLHSERLNAIGGENGGLLLAWKEPHGKGLIPSKVEVKPQWDHRLVRKEGVPGPPFEEFDQRLLSAIEAASKDPKWNVPIRPPNKSKVFLQEINLTHDDEETLLLHFGSTDYQSTLNIQKAYSQPIPFDGKSRTLVECYESKDLKIFEKYFGVAFIYGIFLTGDGYLLVGQRPFNNTVAYAQGEWCVSAGEAIQPASEHLPHKTVIRCLKEEWLTDAWVEANPIDEQAIRLVAVGREWGANWNTALVYAVKLKSLKHTQVFGLWERCTSKAENSAVGVVRVHSREEREGLLESAKRNQFDPERLKATNGALFAGAPYGGKFHDTLGLAGVVLAMEYFFGESMNAPDVTLQAIAKPPPEEKLELSAPLEPLVTDQSALPDGDWLMPPISKTELAKHLGVEPRKLRILLKGCDLRTFGNRQTWTVRLDKMPQNLRKRLENLG